MNCMAYGMDLLCLIQLYGRVGIGWMARIRQINFEDNYQNDMMNP